MGHERLSKYLSFLLRHHPEALDLQMDTHGWVSVEELLYAINKKSRYSITMVVLKRMVSEDTKGRYRLNSDETSIKACQGHSIPWVQPELSWGPPPQLLYHGTTLEAWTAIQADGAIRPMGRHHVHLQPKQEQAWQSAIRWHKTPVVLVVEAGKMAECGYPFGMADNGVWCTSLVPTVYVSEIHQEKKVE